MTSPSKWCSLHAVVSSNLIRRNPNDVTDTAGRKIQVKAMGLWMSGRAAKFSPFRSFDCDTAVFLVFESATFELSLAREVSAEAIESVARYSPHTNGRQPTLRQMEALGVDVTGEMRKAYEMLDAQIVYVGQSCVWGLVACW